MKTYTYRVICSFTVQHSFTESEVEQDPGGHASDVVPTDEALSALREELEAALVEDHAVSCFDIHAESDDLLGTDEHDT